ncbi:MAG TPA: RDD family protein [Euzebyales bacterium]
MSRDHVLVSPEAVPLDVPEATVGSRGVAVMIDWALQTIAYFVLIAAVGASVARPGAPEWVIVTAITLVVFLAYFGYPIAFETVWRGGGRTPGKALMGLRVVTVEGAPVRFRHAAIRAALGLVDFAATFGLGAVLASMLSRRNQRLGDMVAGTVVIRERVGSGTSRPHDFTVPAAAGVLADDIDTSALGPRDYAAVRAYLLRADALSPARRDDVGRELLAALEPRLGPVPDALEPQVALQTVAARYQQRHRADDRGAASPR